MKSSRRIAATAALALTAIYGVSFSQEPAVNALGIDATDLPKKIEDFNGVRGGIFEDGRLLIGGQPDEDALHRLRELGVTAVVNLRTPDEMDDRDRVPFDEAKVVRELGMEYIHIPLGGEDHPYTAEAVKQFAVALEENPGRIFLHCTVAWRASYLWTAYLILYQDFDLAAALDRGQAIAISPPPLQGLLGKPLTLVFEQ
ncbi:MAG: sulfur transferase domain-containing protein [Acidobacteriota bacterium]